MEPDIDKVRGIPDLYERVLRADQLAKEYTAASIEMSRVRREGLVLLGRQGVSNAAMARKLGISPQRISSLLKSGPRIEAPFLARGPVTVVMARKPEAGGRGTGRLVAEEDHHAFAQLATLAGDLGLPIRGEALDTPCIVNLNRPGLVVFCGPRLAPNLNDILRKDPHIRFQEDDRGWHLIDVDTGTVFRSPMDAGKNGDFAYFGRLLRPDKQGTFLYAAGIHAMGESGAVHLLCRQIGELYSEVDLKPFSTIISCRYDPTTLDVLDSQRVTPLYTLEG